MLTPRRQTTRDKLFGGGNKLQIWPPVGAGCLNNKATGSTRYSYFVLIRT